MIIRLIVLASLFACGCASVPLTGALSAQALPPLSGSYYTVRPGETLWSISQAFGVDVATLASVNRLPSANRLEAGQRLFIPLPTASSRFLWPVRGSVQRAGTTAIEIAGSPGTLVRASRSGRVGVATHQLSGWGRTIVIMHDEGYASIYAGLDQLLVNPGGLIVQGAPIGRLGSQPLHFEIRLGTTPRNPLTLLASP